MDVCALLIDNCQRFKSQQRLQVRCKKQNNCQQTQQGKANKQINKRCLNTASENMFLKEEQQRWSLLQLFLNIHLCGGIVPGVDVKSGLGRLEMMESGKGSNTL